MITVFINGRFLSAPLTGVQRVAYQLLDELDDRLRTDPSFTSLAGEMRFELLHPKRSIAPSYRCISSRQIGSRTGQYWEQIELVRATSGGLLLNLCNMGPVVKRNCITMIHDAQVRSAPQSYSLPFRLWYRVAQPLMGRSHRRILTVSQFSRSELTRLRIARADKISVIPNGCDHIVNGGSSETVVGRLGLKPRGYVISSANTQRHKNIGVLLRAFSDERLANETLVLFGGARRADFEAIGHQVPTNVLFTGRLSDGDIAGLLQQALCLACPSLTEGFGLMPLEAMALGCPAVIAPCGALPEVCTGAALAADGKEPAEWIAQIERLRDDRELWSTMSDLGCQRASQYTWNRSVTTLVGELSRTIMMCPTETVSSHAATHEHI
jgi:glycosyltransferase involved in cell wall biosynthesis